MIYDLICIVEHKSYNFVVLITYFYKHTLWHWQTLCNLSIKIQGKEKQYIKWGEKIDLIYKIALTTKIQPVVLFVNLLSGMMAKKPQELHTINEESK